MSSQPPTPRADAEAAAARAEEAGSPVPPAAPAESAGPPPTPSAPEEKTAPGPAAAPAAPAAGSGTTATAAAPGKTAPALPSTATAPAPAPATAPASAGPAEAAGPTEAAGASEASGAGVAVAAAVGAAPPDVRAGTGTGRPRKPVLAGAAFLGAALIAVPLLLAGSAKDEDHRGGATGLAAEGSDTVLNPESAPAGLGDYVAGPTGPSPSPTKPRKSATPKAAVAAPVAPAPAPRTSSPPEKKPTPTPPPKPKPKATPEPVWSTETVYATSVLEVNQAWTTNRIRMVMQTDGNLVVYNERGKPLWASMTFGENHRAIFQTDGNLVIHNGADRPIWASRSHGHDNAQLVLRADGKVVILHNGTVIWST
ncbi:mannose-binding protein [Streptomyces sp. NPDC014882]|uniref:mannose-binding protein n=1 Tax=Streptomyces sp. NPDC014882 TaxID=3364927 RepID=UPI0036FEA231